MGKILIITAMNDKNLSLAKDLQSLLSGMEQQADIISLEDLHLPLFSNETKINEDLVAGLIEEVNSASGFIFCAPEYNGGVPPVLSNAIIWISFQTKNWRDAFNGKFALIATHSSSSGQRFLTAFRSQLEYMGTNVLARTISVTKEKPLKEDSVKRILQGLIDVIR
ncbi:MAG: NAD(P)H-dependent oxidoreductase [Candidatus Marinimicrobia bacterium]|nr:NAD(P)H-dependent oxidoreductase [Candidatus Neomarinimicrobiota bacterium]